VSILRADVIGLLTSSLATDDKEMLGKVLQRLFRISESDLRTIDQFLAERRENG